MAARGADASEGPDGGHAPVQHGDTAAAALFKLFGGARANRYFPGLTPPDGDGKVKPIRIDNWCSAPTVEDWERHLHGEFALGILPPDDDGNVLFGVIDVDAYDTISAVEIADAIDRLRLPLVPTRSKSGGAHVHLFAQEPADPAVMESALRNFAARLGIKLKKVKGKGNEVIVTANIWMPYFGGDQMACGCVKRTGAVMTVGEFLRAAEGARVSAADLAKLAKPPAKSNGVAAPETSDAGRPEYAARKLAEYVAELAVLPRGSRNETLNKRAFHLATMIPRGWIERETIEHAIFGAIEHWDDQPKTSGTFRGALDDGARKPHPDLRRVVSRDAARDVT